MEITNFESSLAAGIATLLTFLDHMLEAGINDRHVSFDEFFPAVVLKDKIARAVEEYSASMLKLHGYED